MLQTDTAQKTPLRTQMTIYTRHTPFITNPGALAEGLKDGAK
jgi:hypothetical protein